LKRSAKDILRAYLRRLTNLSGNSRSLLLLRLYAEQLMDVHELSHLNGERSFEVIRALIAGKSKKICPLVDSRVEASNEASKKLKKLQRLDRFLFEERGSNDLHVGWPFLRGKFSDGTLVRCPLLYFPVKLTQNGQFWHLEPRKEAGITLNKSFLLAYSFYNKVKPEEDLLDLNFEDFDLDSTVFRTQLYQSIKDKIEINFNPDNFRDELTAFESFKKTDFEQKHSNGSITLYPEAVLGIFPQAGSQLVPDYIHLIENETIEDLEDFFAAKSLSGERRETPARISEEKVFAPFTLDAYQESAIHAIKRGESIVVQGPPGTGKSQLICNLLADAMASGKRALLVCQKRAALDVVYNRLKKLDLGDFLGLVHDFRNDRKNLFDQISRQIEHVEDFKARNRGIDVIQTERRFFQVSRRIDQLAEELEEFRSALFHDRECGVSVKELYLGSDLNAPSINIRQEYQYFAMADHPAFLRKLQSYVTHAARFDLEGYPWNNRKSFASYSVTDEMEIENAVRKVPEWQQKVSEELYRLLGVHMNLEDAESLFVREVDLLGMITVLKDPEAFRYFQAMIAESDDETSLLWLANMERVCMNCFEDESPESTIPSDQLGKIQDILNQRMRAKRSLIRWIRWEFFSDNKFVLKRVLVGNDLAYNKIGLKVLEQRIDSRLNLEHQLTAIKAKHWLIDLPSSYRKDVLQKWFERQKFAIRAKIIFNSAREIKETVHVHKLNQQEFINLILRVIDLVKDTPQKKAAVLKYISPYQFRQLIFDPGLAQEMISTLRRDFDNLCAFDTLKEGFKFFERDTVLKLYDYVQEWNVPRMQSVFQNSIFLAWIDHIETKYPILKNASLLKMEESQKELQQLVAEKRKLSEDILLVRARERVYDSLAYNRLNNQVTYRDLLHQVSKRKKLWPLRKVVETYHEELFQLVPCWMASPEAVSAIFPMTPLFDVVIFDEASQCFSERGVPAMYRGKQIVVAGDSQQLRPNELYQVRFDEDADAPDLEVDSLLELVERYVSTVHLKGHYRSRSLELIDFSNKNFYKGNLQLLPDRKELNQQSPAIEYCKVEGIWENQINRKEAEAVVERVMQLLEDDPGCEIGVVTFNAPQQMLVMDLLDQVLGRELPTNLFVKNIENVQGDEKDVIIFSIGYAPDKKGKMSMQFGSLNTVGGENRLNVAVSRAREKIILITSILPDQLRTSDLQNDGPKLLQQYLRFAQDVSEGRFVPTMSYASRERAGWYLNSRLQYWCEENLDGFTIGNNTLPFSDLSIRDDNHYIGIVLTDDARYKQALSAKEAHAYTPALLAQKNWNYRFVFSRNFWRDQEKVESELRWFAGASRLTS